MNKCLNCGSEKLNKVIIDKTINYNKAKIEIKGLETFECEDCKEVFISTHEAINNYLHRLKSVVA